MDNPVELLLDTIWTMFAEKAVQTGASVVISSYEKSKIKFRIAFRDYLTNINQRYSIIKTLLYNNQPVSLNKLYVSCDLLISKVNGDQTKISSSLESITTISDFCIITGSGGTGKTTLLKHLIQEAINSKLRIPAYIELRNICDESIEDAIYKQMAMFGFRSEKEQLLYALNQGMMLFLFDGLDEVKEPQVASMTLRISQIADKYPKNVFIITSRDESILSMERFFRLKLLPMTIEQASELVSFYDCCSEEIRNEFIDLLKNRLFKSHYEFAANPLLLSIMFMSYQQYLEIPDSMYIFYEEAYTTLCTRHDEMKTGYKRELYSGLSKDDLTNILHYFSFITYINQEYKFSKQDILDILADVQDLCDRSKLIRDFWLSVCILILDGRYYTFAHRSFQEYFAAAYVNSLSDTDLKPLVSKLIDRDSTALSSDAMFRMLQEMNKDRFNKVILPLAYNHVLSCDLEEDKFVYILRIIYEVHNGNVDKYNKMIHGIILPYCRRNMKGVRYNFTFEELRIIFSQAHWDGVNFSHLAKVLREDYCNFACVKDILTMSSILNEIGKSTSENGRLYFPYIS